MASSIQKEMEDIGKKVLKKHKEIEDYKVSADAGTGPRIFFTLEGAEGDVSAARVARKELGKTLEKVLDDKAGGLLKHKMRSVNRGDDLILEVSIVFP